MKVNLGVPRKTRNFLTNSSTTSSEKKKLFLLVSEGPYCEIRRVNYSEVPMCCSVQAGILLIEIRNSKIVDSTERS